MVKYGLRPRTLKAELFSLLAKKGSSGIKVSELARSSQVRINDIFVFFHNSIHSDLFVQSLYFGFPDHRP